MMTENSHPELPISSDSDLTNEQSRPQPSFTWRPKRLCILCFNRGCELCRAVPPPIHTPGSGSSGSPNQDFPKPELDSEVQAPPASKPERLCVVCFNKGCELCGTVLPPLHIYGSLPRIFDVQNQDDVLDRTSRSERLCVVCFNRGCKLCRVVPSPIIHASGSTPRSLSFQSDFEALGSKKSLQPLEIQNNTGAMEEHRGDGDVTAVSVESPTVEDHDASAETTESHGCDNESNGEVESQPLENQGSSAKMQETHDNYVSDVKAIPGTVEDQRSLVMMDEILGHNYASTEMTNSPPLNDIGSPMSNAERCDVLPRVPPGMSWADLVEMEMMEVQSQYFAEMGDPSFSPNTGTECRETVHDDPDLASESTVSPRVLTPSPDDELCLNASDFRGIPLVKDFFPDEGHDDTMDANPDDLQDDMGTTPDDDIQDARDDQLCLGASDFTGIPLVKEFLPDPFLDEAKEHAGNTGDATTDNTKNKVFNKIQDGKQEVATHDTPQKHSSHPTGSPASRQCKTLDDVLDDILRKMCLPSLLAAFGVGRGRSVTVDGYNLHGLIEAFIRLTTPVPNELEKPEMPATDVLPLTSNSEQLPQESGKSKGSTTGQSIHLHNEYEDNQPQKPSTEETPPLCRSKLQMVIAKKLGPGLLIEARELRKVKLTLSELVNEDALQEAGLLEAVQQFSYDKLVLTSDDASGLKATMQDYIKAMSSPHTNKSFMAKREANIEAMKKTLAQRRDKLVEKIRSRIQNRRMERGLAPFEDHEFEQYDSSFEEDSESEEKEQPEHPEQKKPEQKKPATPAKPNKAKGKAAKMRSLRKKK